MIHYYRNRPSCCCREPETPVWVGVAIVVWVVLVSVDLDRTLSACLDLLARIGP